VHRLALAEHRRGVRVVARISAARRNTAARSSHGNAAHAGRALSAASIAAVTSAAPAWWNAPSGCRRLCGITIGSVRPVRTSRPSITSGTSISSADIAARRRFNAAFSGLPGA
jgi:hypothetical protein